MASFKYAHDIGVDSIGGIEKAENQSGVPHSVISTYRPGSITLSGHLSYHARKNAVDSNSSPANMRALAQWIMDHFGPYTLELIHSTGKGYFIINGKVVSASRYGAAIVNQHYNHVHWAITNSGLKAGGVSVAVSGGVDAIPAVSGSGSSYDASTNNGCAMMSLVGIGSVATVLASAGLYVAHLLG